MRISIYDVEDTPLAKGGMGAIYKGTDPSGRLVAIKKILAQYVLNTDIRARFHQEVEILNRLDHPNIVKMFASFEIDGDIYLVMEFVKGRTLEEIIRKEGALDEQRAIGIMSDVLKALAHVHQNGIVHRDLKPSNIMVRDNGTVCLLDFGIAKDINGKGLTVGQLTIGTTGYMSPEQAEGLNIDGRSDIYSLGCVLYYLLTGRNAVNQQQNDHAVRIEIITTDIPDIRKFRPDISQHLYSVLKRATDKNMLRRFQSCDEFRQALQEPLHAATVINASSPGVAVPAGMVVSVGRENCTLNISDPRTVVSRHHADIDIVSQNGHPHFRFTDRSANGTTVEGRRIHNESVILGPADTSGARPEIYLAGSVPLPWDDVLRLFNKMPEPEPEQRPDTESEKKPNIGLLVLSFIFPIIGWILYFRFHTESPEKARAYSRIAWVSVGLSAILTAIKL